MANSETLFEIEVRCHFDNPDEAYKALPFLRACLQREVSWVTRFYGLILFKSGQLLRVSEVVHRGEVRNYLGWKGPDIGTFANVRREVDEETTGGLINSEIMRLLGAHQEIETPNAVVQELEHLGHYEFMSFQGNDLTGYDELLDIKVKLMTCPILKWPHLLELEKTAHTEQEATRRESELRELTHKFHLQNRLVKEEPPSLLYDGLFDREYPTN